MRAYHRVDPLMDERKSHYSPAQFGAFLKVQLLAGRQSQRGRFRSVKALTGALPQPYARIVPFLVEQGDLVVQLDGTVYVDGWDEWQEGDYTVKERMARLRNRQRNSTVTPTVTEPSPTAIRSSVGVSVSSSDSVKAPKAVDKPKPRASSPTNEPRLTKRELDSWSDFTAKQWQPFKEAWLARGLHYAPFGDPDDDDTSQRGLLWQVADARPNDLGQWVREAPPGTARDVITYVLEQWHSVRADAGVDDEWEEQKREERRVAGGAMTRIGDVLSGAAQ